MKYTWICQTCGTKVVVNRNLSNYNTPPDETECVCDCNDYKRVHCEGSVSIFNRKKGNYNSNYDK